MKLTITSEDDLNEPDLKSASGEYVYQGLLFNYPVFKRMNVEYRYGTGYNDVEQVSYSLSYLEGQWRVRRNDSANERDWSNAELVFRRKTDCKFLRMIKSFDFIRSKFIRDKGEMGRV